MLTDCAANSEFAISRSFGSTGKPVEAKASRNVHVTRCFQVCGPVKQVMIINLNEFSVTTGRFRDIETTIFDPVRVFLSTHR